MPDAVSFINYCVKENVGGETGWAVCRRRKRAISLQQAHGLALCCENRERTHILKIPATEDIEANEREILVQRGAERKLLLFGDSRDRELGSALEGCVQLRVGIEAEPVPFVGPCG